MKINPAFVFRKVYDVNLLVPVRKNAISSDVISLNDTAALIFEDCEKSDSEQELAELLADRFVDVSREEVISMLVPYIRSLLEQGFIERSGN